MVSDTVLTTKKLDKIVLMLLLLFILMIFGHREHVFRYTKLNFDLGFKLVRLHLHVIDIDIILYPSKVTLPTWPHEQYCLKFSFKNRNASLQSEGCKCFTSTIFSHSSLRIQLQDNHQVQQVHQIP